MREMFERFSKFGDVEIEKEFHSSKKAIDPDKVDTEEILFYPMSLLKMAATKKRMQNNSLGIKAVKQKLDHYSSSFQR